MFKLFRRVKISTVLGLALLTLVLGFSCLDPAFAQAPAAAPGGAGTAAPGGMIFPSVNMGVGQSQQPQDLVITLQILFLMTLLTSPPRS